MSETVSTIHAGAHAAGAAAHAEVKARGGSDEEAREAFDATASAYAAARPIPPSHRAAMTTAGDTIPEAVIVDEYDGHTWHEDEAGHLLTVEAATELAGRFNGRIQTGHAVHRFRVFALVPAGTQSQLQRMHEAADRDDEHDTLTDLARRAGILWQCPRQHPEMPDFDCGWDNPEEETTCGQCGKHRPTVARCGHCGEPIHNDGRAWVDDSFGDVCGWDGGNEPHEPAGSYERGECTCTGGSAGCPVHDPI